MSLDLDITLLSRVPLFEGFEKGHLRLLAFGADRQFYKPNKVIFRKGAYADGGIVIVSGTIALLDGNFKEAAELERFGPASLIGELAMITEGKRPVMARAEDQVEVIKISRLLFRRMLEEFPHLATLLHQRITTSVRDFVARLEHVQHALDRVDTA